MSKLEQKIRKVLSTPITFGKPEKSEPVKQVPQRRKRPTYDDVLAEVLAEISESE